MHYEQLKKDLDEAEMEIFNLQNHYDVLTQNYEALFEYLSEINGLSVDENFDNFCEWLINRG